MISRVYMWSHVYAVCFFVCLHAEAKARHCHLLLFAELSWDRISHWAGSLPFEPDWVPRELLEYLCLLENLRVNLCSEFELRSLGFHSYRTGILTHWAIFLAYYAFIFLFILRQSLILPMLDSNFLCSWVRMPASTSQVMGRYCIIKIAKGLNLVVFFHLGII